MYGNICNLWADLSGYIPENVPAKISCSFGNRICSGDCNSVIRFFYPTAVVEMLCMAIGLMFISLMLQRPEERLDMITGLDKMTAYMDDMRHAFRTRKRYISLWSTLQTMHPCVNCLDMGNACR